MTAPLRCRTATLPHGCHELTPAALWSQLVEKLGWKCFYLRPKAPDTRGAVAMVIEGGRMQAWLPSMRNVATHVMPSFLHTADADVLSLMCRSSPLGTASTTLRQVCRA